MIHLKKRKEWVWHEQASIISMSMSSRGQTATLSSHLAVLWPRVLLSVSGINADNPEPSLIGCVTLTRPLDISEPLVISSSLEVEQ